MVLSLDSLIMTPNDSGSVLQQSEGRSPMESSGGGGGHVVEGNNKGLKKGPWTASEDQILMDYVRKHGEGNWNSVQRNSGLNRCGKSCRLRWANHLRPNLKKGAFSPDEERLILELHAKYGNKWARMASQLPGRTDNEIKNYWNTRVKRRQRQGLPLYPHDIKQSQYSHSHSHSQPTTLTIPTGLTPSTTTATTLNPLPPDTNGTTPTFCFQFQNQTQGHNVPTLSQTPSSLSPLSSSHQPKPLTDLPVFDPNANNSSSTHSFNFHRYKRYHDSGGSSPPISPTPQRSASIPRNSSMHDITSFQLTSTDSMPDMAFFQFPRTLNPSLPPLPFPPNQFEYSESFLSSTGSVYSLKSELPSNQVSPTQSEITINTKVSSDAAAAAAAVTNEAHGSSGLLEDLLQEAEGLACGGGGGGNNSKRAVGLFGSFDEKRALDGYDRWLQATSSVESSYLEAKPVQDDHLNSMPEDLSKLFSFIPSTESVSDWYSDSGELSNSHSSGVTDASFDFDMSLFPVAGTADHGRAPSSWDKLPGIC